jgi:hypothetical protein
VAHHLPDGGGHADLSLELLNSLNQLHHLQNWQLGSSTAAQRQQKKSAESPAEEQKHHSRRMC